MIRSFVIVKLLLELKLNYFKFLHLIVYHSLHLIDMSKKDYYTVLGVSKNSSPEEIKKAYRKLAIKYHPDRNPDNKTSEDRFKEAAEAYDVLSNSQKKQRYDRYGHQGLGQDGGGFNMNMDDIFSNIKDIFGDSGFGDIFGDMRGSGGNNFQSVNKGDNLRIRLKLNLKEIAKGVQKNLKVKHYIACDTCSGSGAKNSNAFQSCVTCGGAGQVNKVSNTMLGRMVTRTICSACSGSGRRITAKCSPCKGEGRILKEDVIDIKIPAGVTDGMQLSMNGKGNAARLGGRPGDLLILIQEIEDKLLKREGNNLHYDLYISFTDAALGTEQKIPTVDGNVRISIQSGIQNGKILRLRGKGIKEINSYNQGDQLVHVNVWVPVKLSNEEKEILRKLADSPNFKPQPDKHEHRSFFDKVKEFFSDE